jgi:hypothetical protein
MQTTLCVILNLDIQLVLLPISSLKIEKLIALKMVKMTQKNDENTICDHKNKRTIVLNYEKK